MSAPVRPRTLEEIAHDLETQGAQPPKRSLDDIAKEMESSFSAQATKNAPNMTRYGAREMHPGEGVARQALRGATMGVSDRVMALLASGIGGGSYDDARTKIDRENARYADENPVMNFGANMAGALLPGPASLLGRGAMAAGKLIPAAAEGASAFVRAPLALARGGIEGGIAGAVGNVGYQSGAADKSLSQTADNALGGAKLGAAINGVGLPIAKLLGSTVADLTGMRNVAPATKPGTAQTVPTAPVMNPLSRDFWTAGNARNAVQSAEGFAYPEQVARRVDGRMGELVTGGGKNTIGDAQRSLSDMQALTGDRALVMDVGGDPMLRRVRGSRTNSPNASATIHDALAERRGALAGDMHADINNAVAPRENLVTGVEDRLAARSEASAAAYNPLRDKEIDPTPQMVETLTQDPEQLWQKAHQAGRISAQREMPPRAIKDLFGMVDDGNGSVVPGMVRKPTIDDFQTMKTGLDRIIRDRGDQTAVQPRYDAKLLGNRMNAMLADVDAQIPEFAAARQQHGELSQNIDAFKAGSQGVQSPFMNHPQSFMNAHPDEVEALRPKLSEAAKDEYLLGAGQDMYHAVDTNARSALTGIASPNKQGTRRKLDFALDHKDPATLERYVNTTNMRDQQMKNANFVEGGSPTADKLVDDLNFSSVPHQLGQLTYAPMKAATGLALKASLSKSGGRIADETAQRAVKSGTDAAQYLQYLSEYAPYLANKSAQRGAFSARTLAQLLGIGSAQSTMNDRYPEQ